MTNQDEQWCIVPGLEHLYEASTLGKIRNVERYVETYQGFRKLSKTIRKPFSNGKGYMSVCISSKPRRNEYVHRMVAKAFIPNPDNKKEVNHINGIKNDNRAINLEWCTPEENKEHAVRMNLMPKGEMSANSVLTDSQVIAILRLHRINPDFNRTAVGRKLGVADSTIIKIIKRTRWKHISI